MLSTLHIWCESWRLDINTSIANPSLEPHSILKLEVAPSYTYLGVWLVNTSTTKTVLMHLLSESASPIAFL